jgi:hypothetical protein
MIILELTLGQKF